PEPSSMIRTPPRRLYNDLFVLGVPGPAVRIIALLPLLEVAWSDGRIQGVERDIITSIADRMALDEVASDLLLSWLSHEPSAAIFSVGRRALTELIGRAFVSEELPPLLAKASELARATAGMGGISTKQKHILAQLQGLADSATGQRAVGLSGADLPQVGRGPAGLTLESPGQAWSLDKRVYVLGRARGCDVQIKHDPEVSRQHARLERTLAAWTLVDLGSARGTWVNGQRIARRVLLGGELIELGEDTNLRFHVAFQDPRAERVVLDPSQIGLSAQGG
ncbi:MAG: FHA domain-containing protein, partial [Myxococcota bacterium]